MRRSELVRVFRYLREEGFHRIEVVNDPVMYNDGLVPHNTGVSNIKLSFYGTSPIGEKAIIQISHAISEAYKPKKKPKDVPKWVKKAVIPHYK